MLSCFLSFVQHVVGFHSVAIQTRRRPIAPSGTLVWQAKDTNEYSREILLREEAEAPFRKVRFFFYTSLGIGALVSLFVSATRVAAALSGINVDLLEESAVNAAVDTIGLVVLAFLWKNDARAQESRLQRAAKGAELAKLKIRASKAIIGGLDTDEDSSNPSESFVTPLSTLRRGRGIEKRVIIAAGGKEKIAEVLSTAKTLESSLCLNDLLVVLVELPGIKAPDVGIDELPLCAALPVGPSWNVVVNDEIEQAVSQGLDVEADGFCVILKKNGRVGQRTKGVFLENMVNEVVARRESGMDVVNI